MKVIDYSELIVYTYEGVETRDLSREGGAL
jgi:hypothetical protein